MTPTQSEYRQDPSRFVRRFPAWAAVAAVVTGGTVLVGWAFDIGALKSILPGWVSMKPNTALAFVLIGIALRFAARPPDQRSHLGRVCGGGAVAGLPGHASQPHPSRRRRAAGRILCAARGVNMWDRP
jgi:hypothetical protein